MIFDRFRVLAAALALALSSLLTSQPAMAQDTASADGPELVIATRDAPPFAMRGDDGEWRGLAIDLWRDIAAQNGYSYRLEESDLTGMIDGVADGRFDASVGALTITAAREEQVDFTHAFYATGFGIAVSETPEAWFTLVTNFFTWDFFKAVLALSALLLVVGVLFWLAERRTNSEEFPQDVKGVGSGFWFSAVTMTTVGYGDKAPRTPAGKIVALIWMFTAILIISTFTGMIASSLTTDRIYGTVTGPDDLPSVKVGSISGSATDDWLSREGIAFDSYDDIESGLAALQQGEIEAFVYDAPLLRYLVNREYRSELRMLPGTFGRQDYGIALPQGNPLREDVNVALLQQIDSDAWDAALNRTLGAQ